METLAYPYEVKAAKDHICDFCRSRIVKGSTYLKSTHAYDGSVYDWKTHKHCSEIADRLNMYENCDEGVSQDDFMEIINQEHDEILVKIIDENGDLEKYRDIIQQLRSVRFDAKLGYVIRHYKKIDKI